MCIAQYIQSPFINNQVDILKAGIEHAEPIQVIKVSSQEVDPAFINVMIGNNLSHKSVAKSTLCNVAMKGFPLPWHICIHT